MNRKFKIYIMLMIIILSAVSVVLFNSFETNATPINKLWNLQKLEEKAEAGDIEAQLRLRNFYSTRNHHKAKMEYWNKKTLLHLNTPEYSAAFDKLLKERSEKRKQDDKKQEAMQERLQAMGEKHEKLGGNEKVNEAQTWKDGLDAVFNINKIGMRETSYKWRYRLTVNIKTPEGIKSGSAVRELYFPPANSIFEPSFKGVARGEAVFVDLGKRGAVFAILAGHAGGAQDEFSGLVTTVFPTIPRVYDNSQYQQMIEHYHELKEVNDEVPPYLYPKFVHFKDTNNPQTIELVYERKSGSRNKREHVELDRFEEVFGSGVTIKSIIMEMTDDPLDWEIDKKLPWLNSMDEKEVENLLRKAKPAFSPLAFRQAQQDPWEKIKAEQKAKQEMFEYLSKYDPYEEYIDIPRHFRRGIYHHATLEKYLARIPKGLDAMRVFVTVDTNKDGKLSYHEVERFRRDLKSKRDTK